MAGFHTISWIINTPPVPALYLYLQKWIIPQEFYSERRNIRVTERILRRTGLSDRRDPMEDPSYGRVHVEGLTYGRDPVKDLAYGMDPVKDLDNEGILWQTLFMEGILWKTLRMEGIMWKT
jgi:hypothetical protein